MRRISSDTGVLGIEAKRLGAPLLAQIPIDLETRLGGDAGQPVATGESAAAKIYADLAQKLI